MSALIDTKRQQRWIVNAQLLCDLVADKDNLVKVIQTCDEATLWLQGLIDIFQREVDPNGDADDSELQDYRIEACTAYNEENSAPATWQYNEHSIGRQLDFELGCFSHYARHIARALECDATLTASHTLANPNAKPKDMTRSVIFKMMKLNYLNRKVCLMAENLPDSTRQDTPHVEQLFRLFANAQRVRCSSFNKREARPEGDDFQTVKQYYKR